MTVRRAGGFTLIEVLVVITIIAVLVGLLIPAISLARRLAREANTSQRMDGITRALQGTSSAAAGRVEELQRLAGLGGPLRFGTAEMAERLAQSTGSALPPGYSNPYAGDAFKAVAWAKLRQQIAEVLPPKGSTVPAGWYERNWAANWPQTDWQSLGTTPPIIRAPWGKAPLRLDGSPVDSARPVADVVGQIDERIRSIGTTSGDLGGVVGGSFVNVPNAWVGYGNGDGYASWTGSGTQTVPVSGITARRSDGRTMRVEPNAPVPFDLGWCSPLASPRLLQVAGILPPGAEGLEAYRSDRSPTRPWNDSYGHPLVVCYALFIPERYRRDWDGQNRRSLLLFGAKAAYGYNRGLYLTVASAGGRLPPGLATSWTQAEEPAALRDYWLHVRAVCRAHEWTEQSWSDPPWSGVRSEGAVVGGTRVRCLLSAPVELQ